MRKSRPPRGGRQAALCAWLLLLLLTVLVGCAGETTFASTTTEPTQGPQQQTATSVADGGSVASRVTAPVAPSTSSSITITASPSTTLQVQTSTTVGVTTTAATANTSTPTSATTSTKITATTTTSDPYPLTCSLLVDCKNAVDVGAASKATILAKQSVKFKEGETVFDVLRRTLSDKGVAMIFQGSGSSIYVSSINGLAEFDGGRWSGWMYNVNGWYPNYGAGVYKLKSGDAIEWRYTCDLGKDLGQHWLGDDITQDGDGD